MHPIDRTILEFCSDATKALTSLRGPVPSGTLYRHAKKLIRLGWLRKDRGVYQTTETGLRQIAEAQSGRRWDALETLYSPLSLVPTGVHRALIELILAAVVARQHGARPDRHPFFVAFGSTLHWKTSLGLFVCYALGLDPNIHVVDCGSESGKSLTVRRSGTGEATFKRELLEAPFVVLDEFLTADTAVRNALSIFLGGRLVVPFENAQLRVHPVPLLALNPRPKLALEQRIALSAPQIRRAILVDLDAVAMPDLAAMGQRALEDARAHPPLAPAAPGADCRIFHERIVELTRAILAPEAHARVDVEIVGNLATGMTAFIPDPTDAIAQVGYDLGVVAETLGWTRAGWIQIVTDFPVAPTRKPGLKAPAPPVATTAIAEIQQSGAVLDETSRRAFSLAVPEPVRRKRHVPDIALGEATLMRLVWFAHETGRDTDGAIDLLLDFYLEWRGHDKAIETIETILALAKTLDLAEIEVDALHAYLTDRQMLATYNCSFADLPEALRVLELLERLPREWDWELATDAMQAVAELLGDGIGLAEIGEFMARHRRLESLGFSGPIAEALAGILTEAGAVGDQRDTIIQHLVDQTKAVVNRDEIAATAQRLHDEVAKLDTQQVQLERAVEALQGRRDALVRDMQATQGAFAEIEAERAMKAGDLDVLGALRAFLLGKSGAAVDALFEDLRKLDRWRKLGGVPDDLVGAMHVKGLSEKLIAFFQQLIREAQEKS